MERRVPRRGIVRALPEPHTLREWRMRAAISGWSLTSISPITYGAVGVFGK
jgi:hypothetical protein